MSPYQTPDYSRFIQNSLSTLADPFIEGMRERERRDALKVPKTATGEYDYAEAARRLIGIGDVATAKQITDIGSVLGGTISPQTAEMLLGGGGQARPAHQPTPQPATSVMWPSTVAGQNVPRGIRNNNPLNIESGAYTQGQPGYVGSDGRFARFETPEQGQAAADKLLGIYGTKHGINTVSGIINRWSNPAESPDKNAAYIMSVSRAMGVDPNTPVNLQDPQFRQGLIAAMRKVESGSGPAAVGAPTAAPAASAAPARPGPTREQIIGLLRSQNSADRKLGQQLLAEYVTPQKPIHLKEKETLLDPRTYRVLAGGGVPSDDISGLRKEVAAIPDVKRYREAAPIYASMVKSFGSNTRASDLDFVYGMAKIFDPESVVREGEMVIVNKAQSLPASIVGAIARLNGGEQLQPQTRRELLAVSRTRMGEYLDAAERSIQPQRAFARNRGIKFEEVFPEMQGLAGVPAVGDLPVGAPVPGMPGFTYQGKK